MSRYESDLRNWELLKSQQEQEFTISEINAHDAHKMGAESSLKNIQLKNAERVSTPSEFDFKHYEVIYIAQLNFFASFAYTDPPLLEVRSFFHLQPPPPPPPPPRQPSESMKTCPHQHQ